MLKRFRSVAFLLWAASLTAPLSPAARAQQPAAPRPGALPTDPKMKAFIDQLMAKMTLEEKIGQLNLVSVGFDVTGPVVSKDVDANIRKGRVGAVLNHLHAGGGAQAARAGR